MKVDLKNCKKGDILRLRNGMIARYDGKSKCTFFPHVVIYDNGRHESYEDHGKIWAHKNSPFDIVEIIPVNKKPSSKSKPTPADKLAKAIEKAIVDLSVHPAGMEDWKWYEQLCLDVADRLHKADRQFKNSKKTR